MRKVYVEFSALHQVHDGTDLVREFLDEAFDLDGVPPKNGTTVPGVARVVLATPAARGTP